VHKEPIPRLGGLAIFYGFMVAIVCFVDISVPIRGILLGSIIIVTLGVLDDICDINAWIKLLVQICVAFLVIWHGVLIEHFTIPFMQIDPIPLGIWSYVVTVLWVVGVTNAVKLLDGLDGLAVGISSISAVTLTVISLLAGQGEITAVVLLTVAIAGSGFGFMPFNFHPAKIFMGDTGSTFLGFILASVSILGLFKVYAIVSFLVPFVILLLPLLDITVAVLRRLLKGQSPMKPDRGHLHHKLIDAGLTQKQAVINLYTISGLLSLSSVVAYLTTWLHGVILILAVGILAIAGYRYIFQENIEMFKK
jgi:UDP-GlcNAc:undecaprenyl-phosphate GlcNAc-1-phosphate transferase